MSEQPAIVKIPGGFTFDWEKEHIRIAVSRVKTRNDDIIGELSITTDLPTYKPHLHQAKFNFSSSNTRRDLRKQMEEVIPDIDWQMILEQLCRSVLQRQRIGSPIVRLGMEEVDVPPPEYVIYPILPKNEATIIFGDGGAGKSYLALFLAAVASINWYDNPLGLKSYKMHKVLYLDYERSENLMRWRKRCLCNGGCPPFEMDYRRCNVPIADDIAQIQSLMADTGADLLIVDSIGAACGADLNAAETATTMFNALRDLDTTILLLAHNSKDMMSKRKSIFGSVYFWNEATAVWELRKVQEVGDDCIDVGLFNRKFNSGKLHEGVGMNMAFSDNTTILKSKDIKDIDGMGDNLKLADRIEIALREKPKSYDELAVECSAGKETVRSTLNQNPRLFKKITTGVWGLNE